MYKAVLNTFFPSGETDLYNAKIFLTTNDDYQKE